MTVADAVEIETSRMNRALEVARRAQLVHDRALRLAGAHRTRLLALGVSDPQGGYEMPAFEDLDLYGEDAGITLSSPEVPEIDPRAREAFEELLDHGTYREQKDPDA